MAAKSYKYSEIVIGNVSLNRALFEFISVNEKMYVSIAEKRIQLQTYRFLLTIL